MAAQEGGFATGFLPPDHWVVDDLRRLSSLGLAPPGLGWGSRHISIYTGVHTLLSAVERLPHDHELKPVFEGSLARLGEEYTATLAFEAGRGGAPPSALDPAGAVPRIWLESTGRILYRSHTGRVGAGSGYGGTFEPWEGPRAVPDRTAGELGGRLHLSLPPYLAAGGAFSVDDAGEGRAREVYGTGRIGPIGLWAGRRTVGFGPGVGGGIVLNPWVAADGAGLFSARPLELPSLLSVLGPLRFDMLLTRDERNGAADRPWFWASRISISPHSRISLGFNRGVMVDVDGIDLDLADYFSLVVGQHLSGRSGFENAVASIDIWYRPPIQRLPLAAYLEWGLEDSSGAWRNVPGVVAGVQLPALPGLARLSLGLEHAYFAAACCGNPIWYRHLRFHDGWSLGGEAMSHPLGGHGTEWSLYGSADFAAARVRLGGRVFLRDRGEENRFAPDRHGGSTGVDLDAGIRVRSAVEAEGRLEWESGDRSWSELRASIGASIFLH